MCHVSLIALNAQINNVKCVLLDIISARLSTQPQIYCLRLVFIMDIITTHILSYRISAMLIVFHVRIIVLVHA